MSRNPQIEAIHEARYDFETSAPGETAVARAKLEQLVAEAIRRSGAKLSSQELLDALFDDYKIFRRTKRERERPKL